VVCCFDDFFYVIFDEGGKELESQFSEKQIRWPCEEE